MNFWGRFHRGVSCHPSICDSNGDGLGEMIRGGAVQGISRALESALAALALPGLFRVQCFVFLAG